MTGPDLRTAYRAWLLAHHPDRGGDPAAFRTGLQAWRQRLEAAEGGPPVTFHRTTRWTPLSWWSARRAARRRPPRVR